MGLKTTKPAGARNQPVWCKDLRMTGKMRSEGLPLWDAWAGADQSEAARTFTDSRSSVRCLDRSF
jgi:hypothetical protein